MERSLQRRELGDFLRRHRDLTSPTEKGSADARRRAKGLRRSEVASRVGISEQWYTLLEQGRARTVSAQVLLRLADTFGLSSAEVEHLFTLAGKPLPEGVRPEDSAVPDALGRFLDSLYPSPAYVIDNRWDALVWNDGAAALLYNFTSLPRKRRNILLQMFTNPAVREKLADWESHAKTVLAFFRRDYGRSPDDPRLREVLAELKEKSAEFREWWPEQVVEDHVSVKVVYEFPGDQRLEFDRLTLIAADNPSLRVVVFLLAPGSKLARLAKRLIAERLRCPVRNS